MSDAFAELMQHHGRPLMEVDRHGKIPVHPHVKRLIEKDLAEACPQRSDHWYEKRRKHLTASQIASALSENPYETRLAAIRKKVGLGPGFSGNAATAHGQKYEDVAIEIYEKRTSEKVISFGLLESIKTHHAGQACDTTFLAGSPDGITASNRLIEVKCPYRRVPNGKIPSHYVHQVQTLMHILDIPICDFIEYVPGSFWRPEVFSVVTVQRDDHFWVRNFVRLELFWADVEMIRGLIENDKIEVAERLTTEVKPERKKRKLKPPSCEIKIIPKLTAAEEEPADASGQEPSRYNQPWHFSQTFLGALHEACDRLGAAAIEAVASEEAALEPFQTLADQEISLASS